MFGIRGLAGPNGGGSGNTATSPAVEPPKIQPGLAGAKGGGSNSTPKPDRHAIQADIKAVNRFESNIKTAQAKVLAAQQKMNRAAAAARDTAHTQADAQYELTQAENEGEAAIIQFSAAYGKLSIDLSNVMKNASFREQFRQFDFFLQDIRRLGKNFSPNAFVSLVIQYAEDMGLLEQKNGNWEIVNDRQRDFKQFSDLVIKFSNLEQVEELKARARVFTK